MGQDDSRYYYRQLTDRQKALYNTILSGLKEYDKEIKMQTAPAHEIPFVYNCVLLDNPLIFYTLSFRLMSIKAKNRCSVLPDYLYPQKLAEEHTETVREYMKKFDKIKKKDDLAKEKYVHDYCLDNFTYDYAFGKNAYSVLGPVINKKAVCEGIAKFVKLVFDYTGLKSIVVSGNANNPALGSRMESHAWNIVKIKGKTFHLDVTFDLSIKKKTNRYDYFNLSDADILKDHEITDEIPECSTSGQDYYSANGMAVSDLKELETFLGKQIKQGKKHILVKITDAENIKSINKKVMEIAQKHNLKIFNKSFTVETGCNPSQMVFEINYKEK
jgi:hypothetical protein